MLTLHGLSVAYGKRVALDGVDLSAPGGKGVGLLGPNGAGKSTLMKTVMGELRPRSGAIEWAGRPLAAADRRQLGYVPQEIALQEDLTLQENLEVLGGCQGMGGQPLRMAVDSAVSLAGLEERRRDLVRNLSGGMRRRANLVAATLHAPGLLLLDEPTAGVDPVETDRILGALVGWKERGGGFVLSTHRLDEVEAVCERVVFLHEGKTLEEGTIAEVVSRCAQSACVHVTFHGAPPPPPADWPSSLPLETREDRWVVAVSGPEGLAAVASRVADISGLKGLEPAAPDLGTRFRELAGEGLE